MADIELVIRIDEEDFEIMKHNIAVNNPLCPLSQEEMVSKIANGIPLPKGHWIEGNYHIRCSACGEDYTYGLRNYCPNCGAKMQEDEE